MFLSQNAREPVTEIAQKTKMSVGSVIHRMKLLEKNGVILAYRPLIGLSEMGRYWYKINLRMRDFTKIKEMVAFFNAHPDAVYAYQSIGGADLEVEFEVRDYEHFLRVIREMKSKFGNAIESHEHYIWYREHKLTFSPAFF